MIAAYVEIPITRGMFVLIDIDDYFNVNRYSWFCAPADEWVYAGSRLGGQSKTTTLMHRYLIPHADIVDHKNGNGLDNRRSNLRPATHAQNMANQKSLSKANKTGFTGVYWDQEVRKFKACATGYPKIGGKSNHIGYFENAEDAARARDAVVLKLYGEFARLNFPTEENQNV